MTNDRLLGLCFLVVGVLFALILIPAQCPKGRDAGDIPSWVTPSASMAVVAGCGAMLAATARGNPAPAAALKNQHIHDAFRGLAATMIYAVLLQVLGYFLATALAMMLFLRLVGGVTWPRSILLSTIFCAVVYLLFELGFRIRLPRGWLI